MNWFNKMERKKIRTKFLNQTEMWALKEEVWPICAQMYNISEADYYSRLPIFHSFALFYDGEEIIGFLSFFLDDTKIDKKSVILFGIGFGAVLEPYRDLALVPKTSMQFYLRVLKQNPFRRIYIWGMAMSHLSYRMGMRGSVYRYPVSDKKTPIFYQKLLDHIGDKYYKGSYDAASSTAQVKFSVKDPKVVPNEQDLQDPIVAEFIRLVPTATQADNKTGLIYVFPVLPNAPFWFKKFVLGIGRRRKTK
jgi:hypothetical protein